MTLDRLGCTLASQDGLWGPIKLAQGRLWCTLESQDALRKSDWLDRGHHYGIDYLGRTPHARARSESFFWFYYNSLKLFLNS